MVLRRVSEFFPGRSARWVADNCREGRIRGARRIGRLWFITPEDAAKLGVPETGVPTVEDAADELRARGVL